MKKLNWLPRIFLVGIMLSSLGVGVAHSETFILRIGSGHPSKPVAYVDQMEHFFVPEVTKRVKERTQHTVKFIQGYAGTIAKVHETLEAVQKGILDIGGWCVCFEPTKAAALNLTYYVPFASPDTNVQVKAFRKILTNFPGIYKDLEGKFNQKLLAISGFDNYGLGTTFPWEKFSDLKGHKILAAGPNLPWVSGSGAIPVTTTLPTAYNQLQTGIGEGIIMFPGSYFGFKFHEPAPHYKITNFGGTAQVALTMNLNSRKKLPKEVLEIIDEVGKEYEIVATKVAMNKHDRGLENLRKHPRAKVTKITKEAQIAWAKSLEPWVNQKIKDFNKMGLDGTNIFKRLIQYQEELGFEFNYRYNIE